MAAPATERPARARAYRQAAGLEADYRPDAECVGELLKGLRVSGVLATLDPRDRRCSRPHPRRKLGLGDAESSAAHDDDPRQLVVGRQAFVLSPELGVLQGLLDVIRDGLSNGTDLLAHIAKTLDILQGIIAALLTTTRGVTGHRDRRHAVVYAAWHPSAT